MKKKITLFCLLFLVCGTAGFAQITTPTPTIDTAISNQSLEYLQGDGVYESGMMTFLGGLKQSIWSNFSLFIVDAQALAAIFMIIFFAIKSVKTIRPGDDHHLVGRICPGRRLPDRPR